MIATLQYNIYVASYKRIEVLLLQLYYYFNKSVRS